MFTIRDKGLRNIGRACKTQGRVPRAVANKGAPVLAISNGVGSDRGRAGAAIVAVQRRFVSSKKQGGNQSGRFKSTMAESSTTSNLHEDWYKSSEIPATTTPGHQRTHIEDWMVNLRGDDSWLVGDRNLGWFTGKPPVHGECPGVGADGRLRCLPLPNLESVNRQAAQDYFDNVWTLFETLFAGFKGEEPFYRPPVHGLRHPQIFYFGHDACLYVNKLRVAGVLDSPVNAYFESIFEVGVDEMLWDDMHKNDMVWPTVGEVREYRAQVYRVISDLIATHPLLADGTRVDWEHPMWALFMGFEHARIHLETSSVLFRETPQHLMQVPAAWPDLHPSARRHCLNRKPEAGVDFPKNDMVLVASGAVELGKPRDFPSYGWDNEYGRRTVQVPAFSASKFMVTNGEFWHFVSGGGYRNAKYWSEDGWGWRKYRNMKWPFFWTPDGPEGSMQFKLRTIYETVDMQWDWPVDVNYHEAKAYCAWKSEQDGLAGKPEAYRVITEAEHHLIRDASIQLSQAKLDPKVDSAMWAGGDVFPAVAGGAAANLNLAFGSQNPVGSLPPSSSGHYDVMGNAWEWTEDHFNPLEGFEVHHVYDDFSTPCFDGKHHMIMGGSFASSGDNGASIFCRYHFRPHFLQHSGFRLVSSAEAAPATLLRSVDAERATEPAQEARTVEEAMTLVKEYIASYHQSTVACLDKLSGTIPPGGTVILVNPLPGDQPSKSSSPQDALTEDIEKRGFVKVQEHVVPMATANGGGNPPNMVTVATAWRKLPDE